MKTIQHYGFKMLRIISIMVCTIIVINMIGAFTSYAKESSIPTFSNEDLTIIEYNDTVCAVRQQLDDGYIISTYNTLDNELIVEYYDRDDQMVSRRITDMGAIYESEQADFISPSNEIQSGYTESVIVSTYVRRNYEKYVYPSYTLWTLRKWNDYKYYSITNSNITGFASSVNTIKSIEDSYLSALASNIGSSIYTAMKEGGPSGVSAFLIGMAVQAYLVDQYVTSIQTADAYFNAL